MCVDCGIGNIKIGIRVDNWMQGHPFTTYKPCDCFEGKRLMQRLLTKRLINPNQVLEFTREEAMREVIKNE